MEFDDLKNEIKAVYDMVDKLKGDITNEIGCVSFLSWDEGALCIKTELTLSGELLRFETEAPVDLVWCGTGKSPSEEERTSIVAALRTLADNLEKNEDGW